MCRASPGPGGKWQISTAGGAEPHWRADGKELYYRAPDQKLMAVEIQTGGEFQAGVPRALFPGRFETGTRATATSRRPTDSAS